MTKDARLDEFDRDEFAEATRSLWPKGYTRDDFDRDWAQFQRDKAEHQRKAKLQ